MEKIDLKKAREVLPYGAINKIAERTSMRKCDISRILNGLEGKSRPIIEKEVIYLLRAVKEDIDELLSNK